MYNQETDNMCKLLRSTTAALDCPGGVAALRRSSSAFNYHRLTCFMHWYLPIILYLWFMPSHSSAVFPCLGPRHDPTRYPLWLMFLSDIFASHISHPPRNKPILYFQEQDDWPARGHFPQLVCTPVPAVVVWFIGRGFSESGGMSTWYFLGTWCNAIGSADAPRTSLFLVHSSKFFLREPINGLFNKYSWMEVLNFTPPTPCWYFRTL